MIVVNFDLQCVGCDICDDQTELKERVICDPAEMMLIREQLAEEHRTCQEYAHNPRQAKALRRMKRAARKLERKR